MVFGHGRDQQKPDHKAIEAKVDLPRHRCVAELSRDDDIATRVEPTDGETTGGVRTAAMCARASRNLDIRNRQPRGIADDPCDCPGKASR